MTNAQQAYDQAVVLLKTSAGTQKTLEDARTPALRTAKARLNSLADTACTPQARLPPVAGAVQQIYYRPGEMVPAGLPVLSILPPGNIKIRFFIGGARCCQRSSSAIRSTVTCDGCATPVGARRSASSRRSAEYTPPVIYSLEERNKLVFLIEARTERRRDCVSASQSVSSFTARHRGRQIDDQRHSDIAIEVHGLTNPSTAARWCMISRCRCGAARSTASSGRTAPARPRPSACCAAC